jgi:hypothetical protein
MIHVLETFPVFSSAITSFAREYYLNPEKRNAFLLAFETSKNLSKFELLKDGGMEETDIESLIGYLDDALKSAYRWDIDLDNGHFRAAKNLGEIYETCNEMLENWSAMNAVY